MITTQRRRLTEPLGSVTALFGGVLLLTLAAGIVSSLVTRGSLGDFGFGDGTICAAEPGAGFGGTDWASNLGVAARPGVSISISGTLQACAGHPSIGQRTMYFLMTQPGVLVWGAVLFLLWRTIRAARRTGPFTGQVAAAMRRLGWLIIAGSVAAAAVQGFALDQLLNTMITPGTSYGDVISEPIHALVPVPLLAGAALLTFARMIRLGADMDDEIQGTV